MPAPTGQPLRDVSGGLSVVEDQQPPPPLPQLPQDRRPHHLHACPSLHTA